MSNRYRFMALLILLLIYGTNVLAQHNPVIIGWSYGGGLLGGSPGDKIAVDARGGVHFTWTTGIGYPTQRIVYYNYVDTLGNWLGPNQVSQVNGAGYPQLTVAEENRAAIAYESAYNPLVEDYVIYAVDQFTGFGIFQYYDPPDSIQHRFYWPGLTIDQSDFVHIVMTENVPNAGDSKMVGHTYSTDGGLTWSKVAAIDTVTIVSAIIVSSPVSEDVSIVYLHPVVFNDESKNDVFVKQVKYGDNYIDYRSQPMNITEYGHDGDSLYALGGLDAIYDYNDDLHIIWSAVWVTDAGVHPTQFLYHYDVNSGIISHMYDLTWEPDSNCQSPAGFPMHGPSMTVIGDDYPELFVAYSIFDEDDCSADGNANADLFVQYSGDGGANWSWPFNITLTHTPGCAVGNCHSEIWPSLAKKRGGPFPGDFIYLSYIDDRSGGDSTTNNPVYFRKYSLLVDVESEISRSIPDGFSLLRAYPNPFNAQTEISFELGSTMEIDLSVYDIAGRKVKILAQGEFEAGKHNVIWKADEYSSGVYFYRLKTGTESYTRKMTLLR